MTLIGEQTSAKQRVLDLHLIESELRLTNGTTVDWGSDPSEVDIPASNFEPPNSALAFAQEVRLQDDSYPDYPARDRVTRSLAMYAGIYPEGEAAKYFTLDKGMDPHTIHLGVQVVLAGRAARLRAIPENWQDTPLHTPVIATMPKSGDNKIDLWHEDETGDRDLLASARILAPATPTPLVYKSGEVMLINPRMVCPLACSFCIHVHLDTQKLQMANFGPVETVDYMMEANPGEDWEKLPMIKLITGAFRDYRQLADYIKVFTKEMRARTDGAYDVTDGKHGFHLLTNLVTTTAEMEEAQEAGVTSLEHTVEIFDNQRRLSEMRRASPKGKVPGKGEASFEETLEAAALGVKVYGADEYAVAVVLGLDDFKTTKSALHRIHEAGVRQITAGSFVPNAYGEIKLQQHTFRETMEARRLAASLFTLPHIYASLVKS